MTGPANGQQARAVFIGRSDGRPYANEEIAAVISRASGIAAKQLQQAIGDAITDDTPMLDDAETVKQVHRWKVIVGTGLADELGWPQSGRAPRPMCFF